ncbi:TRIC cation channel family protein [Cystobacter fuscus]
MNLPLAQLGPALVWLNIIGIAVFAASGALAAARRQQNLVTFAFFAAITSTGGGTVRICSSTPPSSGCMTRARSPSVWAWRSWSGSPPHGCGGARRSTGSTRSASPPMPSMAPPRHAAWASPPCPPW